MLPSSLLVVTYLLQSCVAQNRLQKFQSCVNWEVWTVLQLQCRLYAWTLYVFVPSRLQPRRRTAKQLWDSPQASQSLHTILGVGNTGEEEAGVVTGQPPLTYSQSKDEPQRYMEELVLRPGRPQPFTKNGAKKCLKESINFQAEASTGPPLHPSSAPQKASIWLRLPRLAYGSTLAELLCLANMPPF